MAKSKKRTASHKKAQQKKKAQEVLRKKQRRSSKPKNSQGQSVISTVGIHLSNQYIKNSAQFPIYECLINNNWQKNGLAYIWLARKTPLAFVVGIYLVDVRCMGIKNTHLAGHKTEVEYEEFKAITEERFQDQFGLISCTYELANSIIYGGIDYARQFGFQPQKDFQLSKYILGEKLDQAKHVKFGDKDGKPLFINGPDDDVDQVLQKLTKAVGENGFHFMLQAPPEEFDE